MKEVLQYVIVPTGDVFSPSEIEFYDTLDEAYDELLEKTSPNYVVAEVKFFGQTEILEFKPKALK